MWNFSVKDITTAPLKKASVFQYVLRTVPIKMSTHPYISIYELPFFLLWIFSNSPFPPDFQIILKKYLN